MSKPGRPVSPTTPALLAKLAAGGRGWQGPVNYDSMKQGSEFVWTNLPGEATPANWSRQVAAFRKLKPNLGRITDHWSLSIDPRLGTLNVAQWEEAVRAFLDDLGYQGCPVVIHRHTDSDVDHAHASVLRIRVRKDGRAEVVSDSNLYRRSHVAAAKAAEKLGLKPLPPRDDAATKPAPGDSAVAAVKRSTRRRTPVAKLGSVAAAFDSLVSLCTTVDEIEARAAENGIDVQIHRKSGGDIQGISARAIGVIEWQKASDLRRDRSLSWAKVQARLDENAARRARAQAAADAANAAARARAEQRVADRLAAQRPADPQTARALLLAANQAKEALSMENDDLEFLTPARPPGVHIDDAGAGLTEDDVARRNRDRHNAEVALATELRAASKKDLMSARSSLTAKLRGADASTIAFLVERLARLVVRLLTLGQVVLPPSEGERRALVARHTIERIDGELRRRADIAVAREVDAFKTKPASTPVQNLQIVRAHDARQASQRDRDELARVEDAERERNRK